MMEKLAQKLINIVSSNEKSQSFFGFIIIPLFTICGILIFKYNFTFDYAIKWLGLGLSILAIIFYLPLIHLGYRYGFYFKMLFSIFVIIFYTGMIYVTFGLVALVPIILFFIILNNSLTNIIYKD